MLKFLILISIVILLGSCQENKFEVGQCIQKPDENTVWKINEIDNNSAKIENTQNPIDKKTTALSSSWIKTKCR
jgi:hypothetical protein